MDLDTLFVRYFGTNDIAALDGRTLAAGLERLAVEFGLERDRGRRFALWALLHMLGAAPDVDVAFKERADRDAAREFMNLADRTEAR